MTSKGYLILIPMIGACVAGCSTKTTGVRYNHAVERVEASLVARIDNGIFPYKKDADGEQTAFRFIEGSRYNKADHAFPLRIAIAIASEDGGMDSSIAVAAYKHGLKLRKRDRETETRWAREIMQSLAANRD